MTAAPPPSPDPLPSPEPDLSGTTLDRYHLLRRLGVGGMGAVYEVEHVQLHKRFALKMLREELAQNELFRHRFLREARAASAVSHPHVVDISDFGETPSGRVYFVMELLEGRDLQELLEAEGRLSWPRTQEILLQVTSALETAHRQGVIHRDIKPSNCFLVEVPGASEEVFVKVLDFGIAKLSGSRAQGTMKLTSTQEIFGTVAYMAPEMAQGVSDDHRSDIYALGVMMYQMLVGELPFTEGNAFQILSQHVSTAPPRPREKQPSIPEGVEAIILKALAKNPNERFSSMQEFGRALRHGSLDAPGASLGGQTTMLHITPIGRTPSGGVRALDKTTPLPSSGPHPAPSPGAAPSSGPHALAGEEPPAVPQRVEPTVVSSPIVTGSQKAAAAPERVEPTVVASPIVSGSVPLAPVPAARKRSLAWLVVPVLGVVGALGATVFVLARDSGEEAQAVVVAPTQPAADEPAADEPPLVASPPAPSLSPPVVVEPKPPQPQDDHEPANELVEPTPHDVVVEPVEPVVPTPPSPPAIEETPQHPVTPPRKPKTDAQVVAALRAKILAKCKATGGTTVRIEGLISSTGTIASPLITPSTGPGACAKKIVMAAKFDRTKGVRPIPRFSVVL